MKEKAKKVLERLLDREIFVLMQLAKLNPTSSRFMNIESLLIFLER